MQKEIFEQPESVVNTMRGRIFFDNRTGNLATSPAPPGPSWSFWLTYGFRMFSLSHTVCLNDSEQKYSSFSQSFSFRSPLQHYKYHRNIPDHVEWFTFDYSCLIFFKYACIYVSICWITYHWVNFVQNMWLSHLEWLSGITPGLISVVCQQPPVSTFFLTCFPQWFLADWKITWKKSCAASGWSWLAVAPASTLQ